MCLDRTCESCVRRSRMNWQCKIGWHKIDKRECGHEISRYCVRCRSYVV